jgi:hypothetical protein
MYKRISFLFLVVICLAASSCKKFLNVVPDDVATIEQAFDQRQTAQQYLFTCYSYMPKDGDMTLNPAFMAGDELWFMYPYAISGFTTNMNSWEIARGNQSATSPLMSYWDGSNGATDLWQAIRDCNIFLQNIRTVPDMEQYEKDQWSSEVMFLKAYYHWWLLNLYGPIPIVDQNLPINATQDQVQIPRQSVDSCFNYIAKTIDSSMTNLLPAIQDQSTDMGRITQTIALSIKARILMTAASPLFNGNTAYAGFNNKDGAAFFNPAADPQKWVKAMNACQAAITACSQQGYSLNHFIPSVSVGLPADLQTVMDLRTAVTNPWNSEEVWGNTNSLTSAIQAFDQPRPNATEAANFSFSSFASVPLNIVAEFYTKNGVPTSEDKTLNFTSRGAQTENAPTGQDYIEPGYTTAAINLDREPRFYADLGFDGSILYGNGNTTIGSLNYLETKQGQYSGWEGTPNNYNVTGYWAVKLVNYMNVMTSATTYTATPYPWPTVRLADLYLLYAEAMNEVSGPSAECYKWIDSVRSRAGIPSVEVAWTNYSNNPGEYTSQSGLRNIIHDERLIEMAFEGQRYWDLRRWKQSEKTYQEAIQGWSYQQSDLLSYYQTEILFNRTFQLRDYFWPISQSDLLVNKNLVQNPGW